MPVKFFVCGCIILMRPRICVKRIRISSHRSCWTDTERICIIHSAPFMFGYITPYLHPITNVVCNKGMKSISTVILIVPGPCKYCSLTLRKRNFSEIFPGNPGENYSGLQCQLNINIRCNTKLSVNWGISAVHHVV